MMRPQSTGRCLTASAPAELNRARPHVHVQRACPLSGAPLACLLRLLAFFSRSLARAQVPSFPISLYLYPPRSPYPYLSLSPAPRAHRSISFLSLILFPIPSLPHYHLSGNNLQHLDGYTLPLLMLMIKYVFLLFLLFMPS